MNVIIVIIDLHFFFVQGNCICKIERKGMIPKFERSMELLERIIPNILYLYTNFIKSLASPLNTQVNLPFPLHQSIDHIGDISHNSNIPMR